jgi:hypothetical protein
MFGRDFGEKCIIVQFLELEKDRKSSQRRVRGDAEEGFEEDRRWKNPSEDKNVRPWMHGLLQAEACATQS